MNLGQQEIIAAAHIAAQKAARNQVGTYNYMESEVTKRKRTLDALAECNFGRFLINEHGCVEPVSHGTRGDDESWTHWAVFDRAEVEAFLQFRGHKEEDCQVVKSGEKCPESDCEGYVSYRHDYDCTRCDHCRSMYDHRENNTLLSKCESMFGGRSYSGPGQTYNEESWARITKRGTRILVTQNGGWDV